MQQEQALVCCAKKLFPIAVLCLGSFADGRSTVTEAIAAALRNAPNAWESDAVRQLIRICRTRTPSRITQPDFPQDDNDVLLPLLPILKLPAGSRRALALAVSDFSLAEAAAAADMTTAELEQKTEKALRQLTFMQTGDPPMLSDLQSAAQKIQWHDSDSEQLLAGIAEAENAQHPEQTPAEVRDREIIHSTTPAKSDKKTVAIPIWGMILVILLFIALTAALLILWFNLPHHGNAEQRIQPHSDEVDSLFSASYISISEAQDIAAKDAGTDTDTACFLSTKLKTDETPPCYVLSFTVGQDQQYDYSLDAVSGSILTQEECEADTVLDTSDWLPAEEIRSTALAKTGLQDILFLKEKRAADSDSAYYKFELLNAAGTLYTIQMDARNAMLMKYTAEELTAQEPENIISAAQAKARALSRIGDLSMSQVIFTKVKLDGGAYLIAFTVDDGTQYLIELNAATGGVNTIDVHPVSADITQAVGLLAARDTALGMAELTDRDEIEFTKAKIDRSNGAYVYELEFKTEEFEYEVSIATSDGSVLKYRVWYQ